MMSWKRLSALSRPRQRRLGVILLLVGALGLAAAGSATLALVSRAGGATIAVTDCASYGASATAGTLAYALANQTSGDTIQFQCDGTIGLDTAYGGPGG